MLKKILVILFFILFFVSLIYVFFSSSDEIDKERFLPSNHIYFEGVKLVKNMEGKANSYLTLLSAQAYIDRNTNVVELISADVFFYDNNSEFTARADKTLFVEGEYLLATKGVKGHFLDYTYELDDNGSFHYDFKTDKATLGKRLIAFNGNSSIKSNFAYYDFKSDTAVFEGDVEVVYENFK